MDIEGSRDFPKNHSFAEAYLDFNRLEGELITGTSREVFEGVLGAASRAALASRCPGTPKFDSVSFVRQPNPQSLELWTYLNGSNLTAGMQYELKTTTREYGFPPDSTTVRAGTLNDPEGPASAQRIVIEALWGGLAMICRTQQVTLIMPDGRKVTHQATYINPNPYCSYCENPYPGPSLEPC